jgi:hypothetical protein
MFKPPRTRFSVLPEPEPEMVVQGQEVDSRNEYYVALALHKLGLDFIYQFEFAGGRSVIGGFILDFLVLTVPKSTPVFVNGEYFHRDPYREFTQINSLPREARESMRPAVILWGEETESEEEALAAVRKKVLGT